MLTLKLAFRGIWRHKLRTIVTLMAIAFGHFMMLIFIGIGDGSHETMIELGIRQGAGHVVVQGTGYQKTRSIERLVARPDAVRQRIEKAWPGAKTAMRVFGGGLAKSTNNTVALLFFGVEPARERPVADLPGRIVEGIYLGASPAEIRRAETKLRQKKEKQGPAGAAQASGGSGPAGPLWCARRQGPNKDQQVVIGVQMAETLRVGICDKIVVDARGLGETESVQLRVVGIFKTNNPDLDGYVAHLPLTRAQKLLHIGHGVHQVAVFVASTRDSHRAAQKIGGALGGFAVEVLPWDKALPQLAEYVALDDAGNYIFIIIVFVIVAIGVLNTILMSVMERTREFGLMRGLGASRWHVGKLVFTEAALIGIIGILIGLAGALPLNHYFETSGLQLSWFGADTIQGAGVALSGTIKSKLYTSAIVRGSLGVFAMAIAAAAYPALRAMFMPVLDAIRHH